VRADAAGRREPDFATVAQCCQVAQRSPQVEVTVVDWAEVVPVTQRVAERMGVGDRFTYVSGRHHGYERLAKPGTHTRSILFLKRDYWVIQDRLELSGKHQVQLWFHFDSKTTPTLRGDNRKPWVLENSAPDGLQITSFGEDGSWTKEEGWVSSCYGERVRAPVFVFSAPAEGFFEITTFLLPQGSTKSAYARVEAVQTTGGRGFEIHTENSHDVLLIKDLGNSGVSRTDSMISDFEYTWMRFDGNNSVPEELVLLGGQKLEINGQKIVVAAERVDYSWFRKDADQGTYVRN